MLSKLSKISLFIFLFVSVLASAEEPVWVGSKDDLTSVVIPGSKIELAKKPKKGRINLRATAQTKEIEVYNWNNAAWVGSGITKSEKVKLTGSVVSTFTNLSECDHIADVLFEIRDSTPASDVYADGFSRGQTDSNGMYKQKVRTVCINSNCRFELKKTDCESVSESFSVTSNPFTYSYDKKLKCK